MLTGVLLSVVRVNVVAPHFFDQKRKRKIDEFLISQATKGLEKFKTICDVLATPV
jgi:hypothetical protein